MNKEIILKNKKIKTKIIIKNKYLINYLKNLSISNRKVFCVVDNKIKNYLKKLKNYKNLNFIYLKGGESIKDYKNYRTLCEKLLSKKIDRKSIFVVVGGGTLGDLCGFVASTILRGVEFKLIPTTLLSQVDSSIGGKNGINSLYGKNLIGTFYHPNEVIIDSDILKSLPLREIKCGYAEIVKHSLINDKKFFNWLKKNYKKIFNLDSKVLETAIMKSIMIKSHYISNDPNETLINTKSRAMLNFGHSIGHALESYYKYSKKINHGEAISIGMSVESKISNSLGYLDKNNLNDILDHFSNAKLKFSDRNLKDKEIIKILQKDKKNLNNEINLVLLKNIGKSFFCRNININKIKDILYKV